MTKLYSLLLLAVALAPIAYGQPTAMQMAAGQGGEDAPHAPVYHSTSAEVLLDQLSNFDGQWIAFRATPESVTDATSADDFVVPEGVMWTIQEVFIDGNYLEFPQPHPDGAAACLAADLGFWSDAAGEPGAALFFYEDVAPLSDDEGDLTFMIDDTTLEPGTYWLSLQCSGTLTFDNDEGPRGYYWERNDDANPGALGNPAHSINPAGGLEYPTEGWNPLTAFDFNESGLDFSFALSGTSEPVSVGAFTQIQQHPDTRDYVDAFGVNGPGAILELPDESLAVFYDVQTTFDDFGPSRLYVSTTTDGITWSEPEELDASVNWQSLAVPQGAVDVVTGRILLTYDRDGVSQALYSDDNGTTWTNTPIPTALFGGRDGFITDLAAAPGGGFVAMTQTFGDSDETLEMATSPDGVTWSTPSQIAEGFLCDGSLVQTSATDFVALYSECFFSFGDPWPMLQRTSTDGGASWGEAAEAFVSEVSFGRRVDMTRAADGTLWAVHTNSEDLFYTSSTDGGATWAASERWTDNDGMVGDDFQPAITMYAGSPMALFVSRGGRDTEFEAFYYGIPGVSVDPLTVAIEPISTASPDDLTLAQNYPNPFVSSTTISFSVQDTAPTQLVVYDLLGREVARLVDQTLTPGTYEVAFDRSALASGVYVYRLVSGATSAHRTMTLVD